jgi:hypothetical protein
MIKLELTLDEAQNLVTLIDAAVRAGGLQAAPMAMTLFTKIKEASEKNPTG